MGPLFIVDGDKPRAAGIYVVYTNGPVPHVAERIMLLWHDGQWSHLGSSVRFREHIYGYIGPLPSLELEDTDGEQG